MPSFDVFSAQDLAFQEEILGNDINKRISVEMLTSFGWGRFARHHMSVDNFGYSAKGEDITEYLGFNAEGLKSKVLAILGKK